MKFAKSATSVAAALVLAACGGGGDSGSANPPVANPPPAEQPKAVGTLEVSASTCDIVAGQGACTIPATAKTENAPNGMLVTPAGNVPVVNTTVSTTVSVPVGQHSLELKNGTETLKSVMLEGRCVPTTVRDTASNTCVGTPVISLASKNPATFEGSAPIAVDVGITGFSVTAATAKAQVTCDGAAIALKSVTLPTTGGTIEFVPEAAWPYGAACTFTVDTSATNIAGTATKALEGTFTVAKLVYRYQNFTFMTTSDIVDGKHLVYPWRIVGTVATPFTNASEYDNLALCGVYDKLHESGMPILSCVTPLAGNFRRNFLVNPLTATIGKEYLGALPEGAVFIGGPWGTFGDTPYTQYEVYYQGQYTEVMGVGVYYYVQTGFDYHLWLTTDGFKTKTLVDRGGSTKGIKFLITFSNP